MTAVLRPRPASELVLEQTTRSSNQPASIACLSLAMMTGLLSMLAMGYLFWPTFLALRPIWDFDPNYSHGYLVPLVSLISALIAIHRWGPEWPLRVDTGIVSWGLMMMLGGVGLHLLCLIAEHHHLLDVLALVGILQGMVMVVLGRDGRTVLRFSTWFLLFMAPLPAVFYQPLVTALQQVVSCSSVAVLESFQLAVYREGYRIHLPQLELEVGEACSGLRQLFAILAFCTVIGFMLREKARFTVVLMLLAIPVAICTNCFRVVLTALIMLGFGKAWAVGFFHAFEGAVVIALSGVLVLILALWLRHSRIWQAVRSIGDGFSEFISESTRWPRSERESNRSCRSLSLGMRSMSLLICLAAAAWAQSALAERLSQFNPVAAQRLQQPLAALPLQLGSWHGVEETIPEAYRYADEHLKRTYIHATTGQRLIVWMTYSQVAADRNHYPEICMEVAGKPEDPAARRLLNLPGPGGPARRFRFGWPGNQVEVAYWHYSLWPPSPTTSNAIETLHRRVRYRPASPDFSHGGKIQVALRCVNVFETTHFRSQKERLGNDRVYATDAGIPCPWTPRSDRSV